MATSLDGVHGHNRPEQEVGGMCPAEISERMTSSRSRRSVATSDQEVGSRSQAGMSTASSRNEMDEKPAAGRDASPEEQDTRDEAGIAGPNLLQGIGESIVGGLAIFGGILDAVVDVRGPPGKAGADYRRRRREAGLPVPGDAKDYEEYKPSLPEINENLKLKNKMAFAAISELKLSDANLRAEMAQVRRAFF